MKYIDAEKLYEYLEQVGGLYPRYEYDIVDNTVSNVIDGIKTFINSLQQEQPEVDLEKEVKSYIKDNFTITDEVDQIPEEDRMYSMGQDDMMAFAKHFYELDKARKEE